MPTWKMCFLHNAWCCQSHTPRPVSRPRRPPFSGSCTPVLLMHRKLLEKHLVHRWADTCWKLTCRNCTWLDVVSDDVYMLVTVWARVFVPEADHVAELVNHDAKLITVLSNGDGLGAAASPPHVGATPAEQQYAHNHMFKITIFMNSSCNTSFPLRKF